MSIVHDLKLLYCLTLAPVRGHSHAERLEAFYQGQAEFYDASREHMLHGRQELYASLPVPKGGVWVDMGGGTGANLEHLGSAVSRLKRLYLVDLSPSLLAVARDRVAARGWSNVEVVAADA